MHERALGAACGALLALAACARRDPPGAELVPEAQPVVVAATALGQDAASSEATTALKPDQLGTEADNVPFSPNGTRLASIAWRAWIYTDTSPKRTRYGYLRAGAVVDARGPPIVNEGCAGGWYRVNPRGFVCVGKGMTRDLNDVVAVQAGARPIRGQALPYLYALAGETPPLLYFKLPSKREIDQYEGGGWEGRVAAWRQRIAAQGVAELLGEPGSPPDFLLNGAQAVKPYGVRQRLHFAAHAGPAGMDSGFAVARSFEWEGRPFAFTTEHDIIALDRTKIVRPSAFHGVELAEDEDLPVAFIEGHYAARYRLREDGQMLPEGSFSFREGVKLTGNTRPGGFWETRDGYWLVASAARIIERRKSFPSIATGTRRWIDISIQNQTLVAYVGTRAAYATLVSTGRGGAGDPEKSDATVRGTFMINAKDVSSTMDGEEDKSDSFELRDVPFVQYFHKGYALHGTYWHDEFGKIRSHGCVNLAPIDSAWLFEWTDPYVPPGWHGVVNKERGTPLHIHL
jgi:lipoprotein-anchoring transpeptidase ErfK/SrfK